MRMTERFARRLRYGTPIIIVSGLPRSGTSMMMSVLQAGGVPLLTDGVRAPDAGNPRGYFEFEAVKELDKHGDPAWLPSARGKAVKIISFLLTRLPENYDYRVIFMQRDLDEVIASQNTLLAARRELSPTTGAGEEIAPDVAPPFSAARQGRSEALHYNDFFTGVSGGDDRIRRVYEVHLQQVARFLANRPCFRSLSVAYRDVVEHPAREARRVSALIGRRLDIDQMAAVVDRQLYRCRV